MLRTTVARIPGLKALYHAVQCAVTAAVCDVSPALLTRIRHRLAWGRWPDLQNPETFDEKLLWLNLFWRHPLKARCGDKYGVRGFVTDHNWEHVLTRLFAVYSTSDEIRKEELPDRFVLKCSHGCKCNVFCPDKNSLDWRMTKRRLDSWMRVDFSTRAGELHYAAMTPRIVCEEFLQGDRPGRFPTDYKLFCFGGKVYCTMVATSREPNGTARLAFYDATWEHRLPYCIPEIEAPGPMEKPVAYQEMRHCAEALSRQFPFVRVDFYSIQGRARLGEMTFTPGACVSADYMTEQAQRDLGRLIELPAPLE